MLVKCSYFLLFKQLSNNYVSLFCVLKGITVFPSVQTAPFFVRSNSVCLLISDGDLLLVPQSGELNITTEMGRMRVRPNNIAVIQQVRIKVRVRFKVR